MIRRPTLLAVPIVLALLGAAALAPPGAGAAAGIGPAKGFAPGEVVLKFRGERQSRTLRLPPGVAVPKATAALRGNPAVAYAAPNFTATASAHVPNDPGRLGSDAPGGWIEMQWNLLPWSAARAAGLPTSAGGIDAPGAWSNLLAARRPGGRGVVVAVLDTGVAYRGWRRGFRRSPDFGRGQFAPGYDFVDDDAVPLDENGHGTHIAGTIAEKTGNGVGLTGVAYGATLMPVRVLDRHGSGKADGIAKGIRFAVDHGADVINMSFNFACGKAVPSIEEELRRAYRKGVVTVASIGNLGSETCVSPPATAPGTVGVGGATEGGCLGSYSLLPGRGTDLLAPGGGPPVRECPSLASRPIFQVTMRGANPRRFGVPGNYVGTSMAAAHASGTAALVLASGAIDAGARGRGRVNRVSRRLAQTARDLGLPAARQGAGLIDAAAATARP